MSIYKKKKKDFKRANGFGGKWKRNENKKGIVPHFV